MKNTIPTRIVTLDQNEVIVPLAKQLEECRNSVLFGLQTMELVNEIPPELEIDEGLIKFQFGKNDPNIEIKKEKYKNWLIKKGFEDLIKGIEYSLREAYEFLSIYSKFHELRTEADYNKAIVKIRKKAQQEPIPAMLEKIEPHLAKPWSYKRHILSINKVRNCLVHRGGLVSDRDFTDQTEKALKLEWVRLKVSFIKDGKEIEIHGTGEIDGGIPHKLNIKLEDDSIRFKQGEIITFNYRQFKEFILTCSQFGKDLVDCLPKKFST